MKPADRPYTGSQGFDTMTRRPALALVLAVSAGTGLAAGGAFLRPGDYPPGSDVAVLSPDGSAVGPLHKLRVPGKYTVFDFYADWCAPCRFVDARLREILAVRRDVAVRKLNVVDFETPLARELGPRFEALPYVVVFTPRGKRVDIVGADFARLDKALAGK
jgi:thiol-disulfide isomerase/thioredoxin